MALISVFAWQAATRRHRAMNNTPTSRIGSAAQGYVELLGESRPAPAQPLIDPLGIPVRVVSLPDRNTR